MLTDVAIMPLEHPLSKWRNVTVTLTLFPSGFLVDPSTLQHLQIGEILFYQLRCVRSSTLYVAPEVQNKHTGA